MPSKNLRNEKLEKLRRLSKLGGGEKRIAKQHKKGKLTARERLAELLDPASFHELEPFVTQTSNSSEAGDHESLANGVVTGYGQINGRTVFVYAQDFTVMGGSLGEMQSHKICRIMDLAVQNGAPIIGLIDSGGARIQEGVHSLKGYAEIFHRNSLYSGVVPQISLILGPCAGGAAYSPAITDFIVMVEKQSYMFITGPDVIKEITGEEIDFESLGGAQVHMSISGVASLSAKTELETFSLCRTLLGYLPSNNMENPPCTASSDNPLRIDEELNSIIPEDAKKPYNMHEVIQRVVDKNSFFEIQPTFATHAVVGFARFNGCPVGIVAQEPSALAGIIDIDASDKITRFVRFCDAFNIPLVTFVDSPGFLPGVNQEHKGIIRHGAKIIFAYSEASVPKVSIVTRRAFGGAYIVMSSKFLGTDINYAWPTAEIAVMGAEGAVNIIYRKKIENADDPKAERERLVKEYKENYLNPYTAAKAGVCDEVIFPSETRAKIISALSVIKEKHIQNPARKHGNPPV
ncbi:MAG: acyl-CoA carboxylase subunit beta [Anaerolineaceae bacterium]|nr:acyl-CoA carboxylase subunit beta [Anaerolineaceae bacterium]